jgi:RNA polymerase primary sigma factor
MMAQVRDQCARFIFCLRSLCQSFIPVRLTGSRYPSFSILDAKVKTLCRPTCGLPVLGGPLVISITSGAYRRAVTLEARKKPIWFAAVPPRGHLRQSNPLVKRPSDDLPGEAAARDVLVHQLMHYARENNEAIQSYLREMGRIPRLSPPEELAAARELIDARRCLRHYLLMSDYVQAKVAAVLRRLLRRQISTNDSAVNTAGEEAERAAQRRLVATVLDRIVMSLARNRRDFREVTRPGPARRRAWRRIVNRRRKTVKSIDRLGLRIWQLQRWQRCVGLIEAEMRRLANCAAALRESPEQKERARIARKKLRHLMRRMRESPGTLNRRLARARQCQRDYDAAKHRLVAGNLRLVVWAAKRSRHRDVSFLDLIQEGNAGLLQAADRWDPEKGKFGTYATWWVRQAMQRSISSHSRAVRLPERVVQNARRVEGAARSLAHQNQGRPDFQAIARLAGVSEEQAEQMLRIHRRPLSLDQPLDQSGGNYAADLLPDPRRQAPLEEMSRGHLKQRLADVLTELNDRQRTVLSLRFGLLDGHQRTLDEVGKLLSLSRERVRQIEAIAVERLRHPTRSHRLRGFLDVDDKHRINRG